MAFITNLTSTPSTGTYLNGLPSGIDNDHGHIKEGGTIGNSAQMSSSAAGFDGGPTKVTIVSGVAGADGAVASHPFNTGTEIQMIASSTVAGQTELSIQGGGSNSSNVSRSLNQATTVNNKYSKTALRNNKWNEVTGEFDSGFPEVGSTGAFNVGVGVENSSTLETSGTDVSANPTQSQPGRMTFQKGTNTPFNTGYAAKQNW